MMVEKEGSPTHDEGHFYVRIGYQSALDKVKTQGRILHRSLIYHILQTTVASTGEKPDGSPRSLTPIQLVLINKDFIGLYQRYCSS